LVLQPRYWAGVISGKIWFWIIPQIAHRTIFQATFGKAKENVIVLSFSACGYRLLYLKAALPKRRRLETIGSVAARSWKGSVEYLEIRRLVALEFSAVDCFCLYAL
jgi:hypothetical protein